jgi:hypothetical protein
MAMTTRFDPMECSWGRLNFIQVNVQNGITKNKKAQQHAGLDREKPWLFGKGMRLHNYMQLTRAVRLHFPATQLSVRVLHEDT